VKVLDRKLLRFLWESKGQAIAVTAVILTGVASFVCVLSAHRNLKLTRESYYREYNFADFWIPLEKAPLRAVGKVRELPGVSLARGRIVEDVNLDIPGDGGGPYTGRVVSMPSSQRRPVNAVHLVRGRYFSGGVRREVILSDRFAREHGLEVGDEIRATMNDRRQPLRIVATAQSPEYVYMIRGAGEFMPAPRRFAILWVADDFARMAFGMREACNEITGKLEPGADVDAVLDRAEEILKPYGALHSVPREDQLSNRYLSDEIKGLGVSARITPTIFLGIAAMILVVMLDRVVKGERMQIGVFKAYGYSNLAVGGHYVKIALAVSLAGALLGFLAGNLMARGLLAIYVEFFQFPVLRHRAYGDIFGLSLLISVAAAVGGASWAVWWAVSLSLAEAMRPAVPKTGHRLLLERAAFLWRRVSFIWKIILRDTFRYKVRSSFTVFGVMVSAAILLLGYFSGDSMDYLADYQYSVLQRHDVRLALAGERGRAALYEAGRLPFVAAAEPVLEYPFTLRSGWREKDVVVTGLTSGEGMLGLRTTAGRPVKIAREGLVIDSHLAGELGVGRGDLLELEPLLGKVGRKATARVREVVTLYLGSGAYMHIESLSRILDEPFAANAFLFDVERGAESRLRSHLRDVPAAASVEIKAESRRRFEETLQQSMWISNLFLSLFAGVIAFAVIYNSTAIALRERIRELATLRVLGFTRSEVRRVMLGQNLALSAAGPALGLPLGLVFCRLIVYAYETDVYRLPFHISGRTFLVTILSVAFFVFVANMAARRRIGRMDMVAVLKRRV